MPYLDIVFHNVHNGGERSVKGPNSRFDYTITFPNQVNVCQTPAGENGALIPATTIGEGVAYASSEWGPNITAAPGSAGGASGMFFSESLPYPYIPGSQYHTGAWTATDQITTQPFTVLPADWSSDWDPATDSELHGYAGFDVVKGWVPLPGLNCPAGTVPPPPPPTFPLGIRTWLPPLGWRITDVSYDDWLGRPQWNSKPWDAKQPPGTPAAPVYSAVPDLSKMQQSFIPVASDNLGSVFMEGLPDASVLPANDFLQDADWLEKSNPSCALQVIGSGDPCLYNGAAPPGSDRYAIYFQASRTFYKHEGVGDPITGLFAHVNPKADPGAQIVALCKEFPYSIIFGNLNLDIKKTDAGLPLNLQALQAAISLTHTVIAIQQIGGTFYSTLAQQGNECLDYALIPNAYVQHVELWAYRPTEAPVLHTNASNHSMMMLRIHCNDIPQAPTA